MLKTRIIPTLLYSGNTLVKSVRFDPARRVGAAAQAIRVYNLRGVDELVFLDIAATRQRRAPDFALIDELADDCFMPLAVGGGIRSVEHVRALIQSGADKIVVNSGFAAQPNLVRSIADEFGSQAVVVAIDARRQGAHHRAYARAGTEPIARSVPELAFLAEQSGAGEILLTSIDGDGTMAGYDLDLIRLVARAVSIPVIASGGCGSYPHMAEALEAGASAVAAASIFHFTESTPHAAKQFLAARGHAVRL